MDQTVRDRTGKDFARFLREFPAFANALLAQQLILMEAAAQGSQLVRERMAVLVNAGVHVPFAAFWEHEHPLPRSLPVTGILGCIVENRNRDPARCFPPLVDWFDDPFAEGRPPLPPPPRPGPL